MFYIHAFASISHQDSFKKENLNQALQPLSNDSELITPNYKAYISPIALRRLSPVLRMGIAAAKECENQTGSPFDAICVGTALGCLTDTEKFLKVIHSVEGDVLSPTSFIQSTHNTIAGQISLDLGNHSYNMTHTQNNLSFEMALIDGLLCCREGRKNVLVGAADEAIGFLEMLKPSIFQPRSNLTSGASFLAISKEKKKSEVAIVDCFTYFQATAVCEEISQFLSKQPTSVPDPSIIFSNVSLETPIETINYEQFSGFYLSSSAFATHMAHDWLMQNPRKTALIVNASCAGNIGLILLTNDKTQA